LHEDKDEADAGLILRGLEDLTSLVVTAPHSIYSIGIALAVTAVLRLVRDKQTDGRSDSIGQKAALH